MEQKYKLSYLLGGFALGVLLTATVWFCADKRTGNDSVTGSGAEQSVQTDPSSNSAVSDSTDYIEEPEESAVSEDSNLYSDASSTSGLSNGTWDSDAVYIGGDTVSYQGRQYRAR